MSSPVPRSFSLRLTCARSRLSEDDIVLQGVLGNVQNRQNITIAKVEDHVSIDPRRVAERFAGGCQRVDVVFKVCDGVLIVGLRENKNIASATTGQGVVVMPSGGRSHHQSGFRRCSCHAKAEHADISRSE